MKKTRLIAILFALIIMILLLIILMPGQQNSGENNPEEPKKEVVVAVTEIPIYTEITADMVETKEIPESQVHPNAITELDSVVGTKSLTTIAAKETILSNHILSADVMSNRLALEIPEGMRAMSIQVDSITGVSNMLRVGDFVDIILVMENIYEIDPDDLKDVAEGNAVQPTDPGEPTFNRNEHVSTVLLQNIEILALDQTMLDAPVSDGLYYYTTTVLALPPEDTAKLALALNEGTVYLVLRGEGDEQYVEISPIITHELVMEEVED